MTTNLNATKYITALLPFHREKIKGHGMTTLFNGVKLALA
jgi:hypothetical protein